MCSAESVHKLRPLEAAPSDLQIGMHELTSGSDIYMISGNKTECNLHLRHHTETNSVQVF